jgi:DNA-binding NtrC family response regulator
MTTQGLLIADEDLTTRKQMAELFSDAGYQVTVPTSMAGVLYGILKKTVKVVVLSTRFDELMANELIPLMKSCNRNLAIILVASELPLALLRRARSEGIFYHALKPGTAPGDDEELRQAVKCAFDKASLYDQPDVPPAS